MEIIIGLFIIAALAFAGIQYISDVVVRQDITDSKLIDIQNRLDRLEK